MGRIADLAKKKVQFSTKNNGNARKGSPVMPVGTREVSRDGFLQEQSMPAHHRN